MGPDAEGWQRATTLRAHAREKAQRSPGPLGTPAQGSEKAPSWPWVRPQNGPTLRCKASPAHAREEEQRGQRGVARLTRARSAVTPMVKVIVGTNVSVHQVLPAEASGRLRFLG